MLNILRGNQICPNYICLSYSYKYHHASVVLQYFGNTVM